MKEFYIQFFSVNTKDYPNLGWDFEINKVMLIILPVFIIACIMVHLFRKNMFFMVKQLTRHGADSPETAKTLSALGLSGNLILKWMLSHDGQLTKLVRRKDAPDYSYEEYRSLQKEKKLVKEKLDFESAEFYLLPEAEERTKKILERYDIPVGRTVLVCVFLVVIFVCIMLVMPELLTLIDNIISFVKGLY